MRFEAFVESALNHQATVVIQPIATASNDVATEKHLCAIREEAQQLLEGECKDEIVRQGSRICITLVAERLVFSDTARSFFHRVRQTEYV